jgi:hypothetical protein
MTRKLNRNFAVAPSVKELEEMFQSADIPVALDQEWQPDEDDPRCSECGVFPCICDDSAEVYT